MKDLKIKNFRALDKDPALYAKIVKGAIVDGKKPPLLAKPMFTRITSGAILTNTLQIASNKENSYQDKVSQIAQEKIADLADTFRKIADNKKPKPSKNFLEFAFLTLDDAMEIYLETGEGRFRDLSQPALDKAFYALATFHGQPDQTDSDNQKEAKDQESDKKFGPLIGQKEPAKVKVEVNGIERDIAVYAVRKFYKNEIKPRKNKVMDLIYKIARKKSLEAAKRGDFPYFEYNEVKDRYDGIVRKFNKDGTVNDKFMNILNNPRERRKYGGLLYVISWVELDKNGNPKIDKDGNYVFKEIQDNKRNPRDVRYLGVSYSMNIRQYRRFRAVLAKNSEGIEYFVENPHNIKNSIMNAWLQIQQDHPELNMVDMARRYHITKDDNPMIWNSRLFHEIFIKKGSLMSRFKEIGWLFEIVEFHKWYENTFVSESQRIQEGFFDTEGSNIGSGGEGKPKRVFRLPYYDLIWFAAVGVSTKSITKYISEAYEVSKSQVYEYTRVELGGSYQMQKEFLKPVVEELYNKKYGLSGIEIFKALSEMMSLTSGSLGKSWMHDWAKGNDWINIDGKREYRYYGETLEFWTDYFSKQAVRDLSSKDSIIELAGKLGIGKGGAEGMRSTISRNLGFSTWSSLRNARKIIACLKESTLGEGVSYDSISKETGFSVSTIEKYFAIFEEQGLIYKRIVGERAYYFLHD